MTSERHLQETNQAKANNASLQAELSATQDHASKVEAELKNIKGTLKRKGYAFAYGAELEKQLAQLKAEIAEKVRVI